MIREPMETDAVLGGNSPPLLGPQTQAKIRIERDSEADFDAIVEAMRSVLVIEEESKDYASRDNAGFRRYLSVRGE